MRSSQHQQSPVPVFLALEDSSTVVLLLSHFAVKPYSLFNPLVEVDFDLSGKVIRLIDGL